MKRSISLVCLVFSMAIILAGCVGALQRGILDNAYISTARPAISVSVPQMPLLLASQGLPNLDWTGVAGGLPLHLWTAVYGEGGLAPMAIVMQAQTPDGWYWNADFALPFSIEQTTAFFNGVTYYGYTHLVNPENDPFANLYTGVQANGEPQLWIARTYAARFNFNNDKIILEYREPLPAGMDSLSEIPYGHAEFLAGFTERAKSSFQVGNCPENVNGVSEQYGNVIRWQFMNQNVLGTVSKNLSFNWD